MERTSTKERQHDDRQRAAEFAKLLVTAATRGVPRRKPSEEEAPDDGS